MQLEFTRTGPYEYSCTVHGPTDPYVAQYNTVQLYSRRKLAGIQRSLRNDTISRNRRNLQNTNSAAAEIAIRFGYVHLGFTSLTNIDNGAADYTR